MRMMTTVAGLLAAAAMTLGPSAPVEAGPYPDRPVKILVGFSPGGATDLLARYYAKELSGKLGQSFVVENRAGAGGNIAVQAVAQAAPDGYTLVMGANYIAVNAALGRNPYDWERDLAPVALIASTPNILVVPANSKLGSVADLIKEAQKGTGRLTFGSPGVGSSVHMSGELFKVMAGVDMTHVPYRGVAPAELDLAAGTISLMFDSISTAAGLVNAGKLRALAVTGLTRVSAFPDVPTIDESGLKGFDVGATYMMLAPAGTPDSVTSQISGAVKQISADPKTRVYVENLYAQPLVGGQDETRTFLRDDFAKWQKVVKQTGVKAD